jgi:methyl-accepting chemotaxis protein
VHRNELATEINALSQDLIAYLDARFSETSQQIAATQQQIAATQQQIVATQQQIASLREETAQEFEQVKQRFEQVDQRFEQVETTARQTVVLVEGLRHELHVMAEGFLGLNERVERYAEESRLSFSKVQAWIAPYFKNLDGRVKILEEWAERQQWDVVESVRRILHRPSAAI